MKKKFYDVGTLLYLRNRKCGLETAAIVGIACAVSTTAVGVATSQANKNAVEDANSQNAELARQSMEQQEKLFHEGNIFNMQEANKAREFSSKEAEKNRVWQAQQADAQMQKAMDWFEKYSSPASQVKQYLDAGLNPASLAGNTSGYTPSFSLPSGSAASGQAASAASAPQVSTPTLQPATSNLGNVFSNMMNSLGDVYNAMDKSVEIEGKVTDNEFKKALHEADLDVKRGTADKLRADVNLINADINQTNKNIEKIGKDIQLIDTNIANIDADTAIKNLDYWFKGEEYQGLLKKMEQDYKISREVADAQLKLFASQVLKNKADASAAYASASYYKSLENIKIPAEKMQLEAYAGLLDQESGIARTQNFLDTLFGTEERELKYKIGLEDYENARYQNTTFFRLLNAGRSVSGSVGSAIMTYYGARGITR